MTRGNGISQARRLAGVALARIIGVKAAARALGVDPRSVSSWLDANADADHDEQAWQAAQALAQERMLAGLTKGDARGLTAWATAAGIASRNVRYAQLIARREQRRSAEQEQPAESEPPWRSKVDAMSWERHRLMSALIDLADAQRTDEQTREMSEDEANAAMEAWVDGIAALSEDEAERATVDAERELSELEAKAAAESRQLAQQRRTIPEPPQSPPPPPEPSQRVPALPQPPAMARLAPRAHRSMFTSCRRGSTSMTTPVGAD
jgi:hypothetical protein